MEMNDILNGLNSCDDNYCDTEANNNCCCGNNIGGNPGFNPGCGCGLGSWIWILLILFYCGGSGILGNGTMGNNRCCCDPCCDPCCCESQKADNCCCCNNTKNGGLLGNCSAYLFLLVILFLCNGWGCGRNGANLANNCGC